MTTGKTVLGTEFDNSSLSGLGHGPPAMRRAWCEIILQLSIPHHFVKKILGFLIPPNIPAAFALLE
jgi:hypothetical protein